MFEDKYPAIKRHAMRDYPRESVGCITETWGYQELENISDDPENGFQIRPAAMAVAISGKLLAVIHSHPDGQLFPSKTDMESQIACDVPFGIVVATANDCSDPVFFGDGVPRPPLLGRGFVHGITDCYSLIRDYYFEEFRIVLPDYPRDWLWWDQGCDLYTDLYAKAGFRKLMAGEEPKPGDVFLAQVHSPVCNHAGIYVGNSQILHHVSPNGRAVDCSVLSRQEPAGRWFPYIRHWLRYAGECEGEHA